MATDVRRRLDAIESELSRDDDTALALRGLSDDELHKLRTLALDHAEHERQYRAFVDAHPNLSPQAFVREYIKWAFPDGAIDHLARDDGGMSP